MRDASDEPQITDGAATKKKSRPRGPTKGIRSKPGIQRVLAWDEWIRPIGRYAVEYKIYCGEISRSKVSILYDTWDDVPEGTKNTLWEDAKREFGIEEDVLKKRDVLTTCDKRWRDFKSRLVTRWITKTRKGPNNDRLPYVMYPFITREIGTSLYKNVALRSSRQKVQKQESLRLLTSILIFWAKNHMRR
ncbi:uncharacterized protein LOC130591503 [Beta vulgaris subsp. vulgaris]|uniref:uncharacterized protein LOC130591503 n=1 Tax=Beta vulgaris subsp. vulgaris TaxID=3555 RepID=UPI0025485169|nr:uncharacterized protein LOC130591503 [Beta vulgaris subsp. vulgaris]